MSGTGLAGKTLFITGASRGIGLAIAKRAACDGANIVIAAKTAESRPELPGTIYTAAREIARAGGQVLPLVVDVRDESAVEGAMLAAADRFGGIDICINNASAISLTGTLDTPLKRYDLMHQINGRGTFLVTRACIPYLRKAENPHVLVLSPPLDLRPEWFAAHVAYTSSKYLMSMMVLGMAEEFRGEGIAFNALWPRTMVGTSAVRNVVGGDGVVQLSRKPEVMADAAHAILCRRASNFTGQFCLDDAILAEEGVVDFAQYAIDPDAVPALDLFVDPDAALPKGVKVGALAGH